MDTTLQAAYAAYFNVARHNFLLVLNSVSERAGLGAEVNDEQIANHPLLNRLKAWATSESEGLAISDKDIRLVKTVVQGLRKALPFLNDDMVQAISGQKLSLDIQQLRRDDKFATPQATGHRGSNAAQSVRSLRLTDMHWVLQSLVTTLMEQRNYCTHAHQQPTGMGNELADLLNAWFDAARRETKSRFAFLECDVQHLLRIDKDTKKEDPNAPYLLSFAEDSTRRFTPRGAAFFCCLFLDKQQGNEFFKLVPGFKQDAQRAHQATLRTYTHWSIRLPFVRIETESTAQSLALDMLNELTRCPTEVYNYLSDKQQKEFEIKPEDSLFTEFGLEADEMSTRMIRHSDRFAPLLMDYFDRLVSDGATAQSTAQDTGIRFQIDLGDFYFAAYPKSLPDGSVDVRRLKQKLLRFGLLSQAAAQAASKPPKWTQLV